MWWGMEGLAQVTGDVGWGRVGTGRASGWLLGWGGWAVLRYCGAGRAEVG